MVEFALILPLLLVILFGILEFAWTFAQVLDTRHGAREAARLLAVNYAPTGAVGATQSGEITAEICTRIDEPTEYRVAFRLASSGDDEAGDLAIVRVERDLEQLTNFFNEFIGGLEPSSEVSFRLERDITWQDQAETACP